MPRPAAPIRRRVLQTTVVHVALGSDGPSRFTRDQLASHGERLHQDVWGSSRTFPSRLECFACRRSLWSAQAVLSGLSRANLANMAPSNDISAAVDCSLGQLLVTNPVPLHPRQQQLEAAHWASDSVQRRELAAMPMRKMWSCRLGEPDGTPWDQLLLLSAREKWVGHEEELDALAQHVAQRWFSLFACRRTVRYAIGGLLGRILRRASGDAASEGSAEGGDTERETSGSLQLYWVPGTTLIALMAALQLRRVGCAVSTTRATELSALSLVGPNSGSYLQLQLLGGDGAPPALSFSFNSAGCQLPAESSTASQISLSRVPMQLGGERPNPANGGGHLLRDVIAEASAVLAPESRDVDAMDTHDLWRADMPGCDLEEEAVAWGRMEGSWQAMCAKEEHGRFERPFEWFFNRALLAAK
jgi:hypothetical protein